MTAYAKQLYKVSEVSKMLGVPISTIHFWVRSFDELDPPKSSGGQRRYRPEDVDLIRRIDLMIHTNGTSMEGVRRQLQVSNVPWRGFRCDNGEDALKLLKQISEAVKHNPRFLAMIESVEEWIRITNSQT